MEYLLLLLAFPIVWPFIAKKIWHYEITWLELSINVVGVVVLVTIAWFAGTFVISSDTEVWNGKILSKKREHGHYIESYQCRCRPVCSGTGNNRICSQVCDTCYRDHYTVDWYALAHLGQSPVKLVFKRLDETSRSVYNTPDPAIFTNCKPGEPASVEFSYTNYVKAVPESLFNTAISKKEFEGKIPEYPRVYGKYRINRVLDVSSRIPGHELTHLNSILNESLKTLGPSKQANIVAIVTSITDPSFRYAVENNWVGGKKNDIVMFIGVDGREIVWADVMTFALNKGNEMLRVKLRDDLLALNSFDSQQVADVAVRNVSHHFTRISMEEFEYLKTQITPPNWVIVLLIILSIGGSVGTSLVMRHVDIRA